MILKGQFCSSLEKIRPEWQPCGTYRSASALKGETFSLQFAFFPDEIYGCPQLAVSVESPLKEYIRIRQVSLVPCRHTGNRFDDDVISTRPGLYPDPLLEIENKELFRVPKSYWQSLWITVAIPKDWKAGRYPLTVILKDVSDPNLKVREDRTKPSVRRTFTIEVIDAVLPEQKLIHTEWFHADCLMNYYQTEAWSEKHWGIVESFMRSAASHGINMIFTPVFTPPLDTKKGGERRTTQLVKVKKVRGKYEFDFALLKHWIALAKKCGFEYLEISHLFSQWGAVFAPKVMAEVNGKEQQIFGWNTAADSPEYTGFLAAFLPELTAFLKKHWKTEKVYFHCSDEPSEKEMKTYRFAAEFLRELIPEYHVFDALSDTKFYKEGLVSIPVSGIDAIEPFVKLKVDPLWGYYCCGAQYKLPSRFLYMTSSRNRILGMLLYRYHLAGFLQWGFNFYNTEFSLKQINPWCIQDAGFSWPPGDAFMVYPGENGQCVDSLKQEVLFQGLQDLRALELLGSLIGREKVTAMLDKATPTGKMTMTEYPRGAENVLALREKINLMIKRAVKRKK